jgi:formylglycine-generating enzyme required for sulfatase activity
MVQVALTETYVIVDLSTGGVTQAATIPDLETNDAYKTTHMVLKRIPAGTFQMGDQTGAGYPRELPVHTVNITQAFYMGVFEVTQQQWTTIEGSWTFNFPGNPKRPAEQVSWNDINAAGGFMDTLSSLASLSFRLPTEAEWEYCCKAGTSTDYSYGDTANGAWMWYIIGVAQTYDVGTTTSKPNPWGLYDMHGNVWEWCEDWYDSGYYASSPLDDPQGPASGSQSVLRGGSWSSVDFICRSTMRLNIEPSTRLNHYGFRVAVAAAGP